MIVRAAFPVLIVLALVTTPLVGQDQTPKGTEVDTHAGLEQFKGLAGEWVGKAKGKDIHIQYKVIAGGSAVVETIFPGTEHEMVSVIHRDGPDLLLTHYCMLGNQPQMKAAGKGDSKTIEFKFVRATNLESEKDKHMHDATYTFVDKDTLRSVWTHYNNGQAAGQVVVELKRAK
jgi:hypothetical protein